MYKPWGSYKMNSKVNTGSKKLPTSDCLAETTTKSSSLRSTRWIQNEDTSPTSFRPYLGDFSTFLGVAPPSYETVGSSVELSLGQTHRSHVSIVLDRVFQFYHCHIIVVIAWRVIFWMFNDFVDGHVLFVALSSIKIIFTCRGVKHFYCVRPLNETSTLKANGRLIEGNTVLFQISVESSAIKYKCQAKQGLPITYVCFKISRASPSWITWRHMVAQSTVRKKMAVVHFTTIPCEPN